MTAAPIMEMSWIPYLGVVKRSGCTLIDSIKDPPRKSALATSPKTMRFTLVEKPE